jgi:hypothetical protein
MTSKTRAIAVVKLTVTGAVLVLLLSAALPQASGDTTVSKRYEAPAAGVVLTGMSDPVGSSGDRSTDVGGVTFDPLGDPGYTSVAITVTDDRADVVAVDICQDPISDLGIDRPPAGVGLCTGRSPLYVKYCVPNGTTIVRGAIRRELPIVVRVGPGACGGPGITYSLPPFPTLQPVSLGSGMSGTVTLGPCPPGECAE